MLILVFPNIKKCTMYSFVNHHSHMQMMICYCGFFCVEALCAFSTFCLVQAPLLHLNFPSNLVVLHSHFKARSSFFLTHSFVDTHVFLLHEVLSHYHLKFRFWNCSLWLCMHFLLQFDSIGTLMLLRACITSIRVCGWLRGLVFWNTLVIFLA